LVQEKNGCIDVSILSYAESVSLGNGMCFFGRKKTRAIEWEESRKLQKKMAKNIGLTTLSQIHKLRKGSKRLMGRSGAGKIKKARLDEYAFKLLNYIHSNDAVRALYTSQKDAAKKENCKACRTFKK